MKRFISLLLILILSLSAAPSLADVQSVDLIEKYLNDVFSTCVDFSQITDGYDRDNSTNVYLKPESGIGGWFAVELAAPAIITSVGVRTRAYISAANHSLGEFAGFVFEAANERDFSDAVILYEDKRSKDDLENAKDYKFPISDSALYKYVRIRRTQNSVLCFAEFYVEGYGKYDKDYSDTISVNADTDGYYAISFDAMTHSHGAGVNITNNSVPISGIELSNPGLDSYTGHYSVVRLGSGENAIALTQARGLASVRNLSAEPLLDLTDDISDSFVSAVNTAANAFEVKERMLDYLPYFGINAGDYTDDIFYDIPIYENMADNEYTSASDIINDFFAFSATELAEPTVVVTKDGAVQTEIGMSGDYVVNVKPKRLSENCKVIAAVYEGNTLAGSGHSDSSEDVSIPLAVNLKGCGDVSFRVFYLSDFDALRPVDAYPEVYADIYMSATGDDDGDGSEQNPYATFDAVKTRIAEINDSMTGDIIVHVADGIYPVTETVNFTEEHGGKNGYDVIIKGDGVGDNPVFTGGVEVTGWQEYRDGIYRALVTGVTEVRNLYINGYGAARARSKHKYSLDEFYGDYDSVKNVPSEEITDSTPAKEKNNCGYASDDGFYVSKDNIDLPLDEFSNPGDLELVWNLWWQAHRTPVDSIEVKDEKYLFHMNQPCFSTKIADSNFSILINEGSTFYIENALELLDEEGEFYFEKSDDGGYIYYKPYYEEIDSGWTAHVPVTETLFSISGSSAASKIENIIFTNLDIRLGAWNKVSDTGLMGMQADRIYVTDTAGTLFIPAQFAVNNADGIKVEACNFSCMGSGALSMRDAVTNSSVTGCSFTDISGTGVQIGIPSPDLTESTKCVNIGVANNVFRRVASEYHQTTAIAAYYGNGFAIENNDIKNTPYTAITLGWGWEADEPISGGYCRVSGNKITDSMLSLSDGASIYSLDNGPSVISSNYIANSCGPQQYAVYLDTCAANTLVSDNVMHDSQRWITIGVGIGKNITARNNYYTIPIDSNTDTITLEDNTRVNSTYPSGAQLIISASGTGYGMALYETPEWRKESIDMIPKYKYFKNGQIRDALMFDECYDKANKIVKTEVTSVSFNGEDTRLTYKLPQMEAGIYKLSVVGALQGSTASNFKVYLNGEYVMDGTAKATGEGGNAWGIYAENDCGNITLAASSENTLEFRISGAGFNFRSFKLEKID